MELQTVQQTAKRIFFLDAVRGVAIILMVVFHLFYSMAFVFGWSVGYRLLVAMLPIEPFIAGAFILCAGFSSRLSHSNLQRGIKLIIIAFCITVVTIILLPNIAIIFGILHFLGVAMVIFAFMQKTLDKIPFYVALIGFAVLFLIFYSLPNGALGIQGVASVDLPSWLYSSQWLFVLGLPSANFASSDYFPILPWIFLFFFGSTLGKLATEKKLPQFMYKKRMSPICFLGRHSLVIYIAHQPLIIGILWVIESIFL